MNDEERARRFAADWHQFCTDNRVMKYSAPYRSPEMVDTGYEHGVILIHISEPLWVAELGAMQAALTAFPWVKPVPPASYHVTVRGIGDIMPGKPQSGNQFAASNYEEMATTVERAVASRPPFTLRLGGMNSWAGIAFAEIYDNGDINRLRDAIAAAYPLPNEPYGDKFAPHLTLASYTEDRPAGALIAAITPFRRPSDLTLEVTALSLERARFGGPNGAMEIIDTRLLMLRGRK